jgi:DeoR family transcriptional regulator, fructose operon transcriptional repressor
MYAQERQQELASMVAHQRRVAVSQAADHFGVTTETVRRDLAMLERRGLIRRVHGGAVPASALTTLELAVAERDVAASAEKDRIALAARDLIPPAGGSLVLDAGTTTGRLAQLFSSDAALTVVTNSLPIAATLAGKPALELTMLGGRVRSRTSAAVGRFALEALHELRVDVSFIGTNGLSLEQGLTTPDPDEAAVKAAMVAAGRLVVVLADSSKIDHESLVRFARLDQVDALVTDGGVSDAAVRALEAADIDVVIA